LTTIKLTNTWVIKIAWAVWICGLPGSGKSTIAGLVMDELAKHGVTARLLIMDDIRKLIHPNPSYDENERNSAYREFVLLGKTLVESGVNVIFDATGHKRKWRNIARKWIPDFAEIIIKCPLEICIDRESKRKLGKVAANLYRKALARKAGRKPAAKIGKVIGVDVPFEYNSEAELVLDSSKLETGEAASIIAEKIGKLFISTVIRKNEKEAKMDIGQNYEVKDISLAEQGRLNIEWAELQMGALMKVRERFGREKPLNSIRIGMALHITKETAALVRTLRAGGAEVAITGCNPLSTQDDVAAALAKEGVNVYGWKGESNEDYYRCLNKVLDFKPQITIDDGCDLVTQIHTSRQDLIPNLICGAEETTTGIIRLRAMHKDGALKYPIIAVNDSNTKHLMDNYLGTGQSTLDGVIRASNILITGKTIVVIGYGNCGKGAALRALGLGANVIVCEVDHFKALQAAMEGKRVMPMDEAAPLGDIFLTLTGDKHVITVEHMKKMKSGAILANSGHFDVEIDVKGLEQAAVKKERIRPLFDRYTLSDGKQIFLCGEGRLVNLACAEGHPSTVMSMSFCNQALACEYGVKNKLPVGIHVLPEEIDNLIAQMQLEAMNVKIDVLTEEQKKYLASWKEGT
jgi:adenosylhomocysteinase